MSAWQHWLGRKCHGNRGRLLFICLLGLARVGCGLAFVWSSKRVVDTATGQLSSSLLSEGAVACGIALCQILLSAVESGLYARLSVRVVNGIRRQLFDCLLHARWSVARNLHTADAVNRIEQDVTTVADLLASSLPALFVSFIQLLAAFAFFCFLDVRLALVTVSVMLFCMLGSRFYVCRMRRYTRSVRESDSRIQAVLQEGMQHRAVLAALEATPRQLSLLDGLQQILQKQVLCRARFSISAHGLVAFCFTAAYLAAFLWGAFELSRGLITFGTMAAFLQLVGQMQSPAYSLAQIFPAVVQACTSAERLCELESLPVEAEGEAQRIDAPIDVCLESVSFGYDDAQGRKSIFRDCSFIFPAGSCTAVLGPTGAGKTTLVRLLLALLEPSAGRIVLRGMGQCVPLSPCTRCNFIYVPQGNTLFSGTVRDNLLLANPAASDADMRQALELAEAGFVGELAGGLDTFLGENGGGLSEGQAQRLAIARALLRPGRVMLFDEATSALDVQTESRIFRNLKIAYRGEKTLIFITHRPHLAEQCDYVFKV